ncbi:hypothetical protein TNCV_2226211 [Trichonephila clavipes]|nr:hypothetical protein TNCV_2226211 [Trichonephila clavipes]
MSLHNSVAVKFGSGHCLTQRDFSRFMTFRYIDLIAIFSTEEHQRVLQCIIGTMCLIDSHQCTASTTENDFSFFKLLSNDDNGNFFCLRSSKTAFMFPDRLSFSVNNYFKLFLVFRY